MAHQGHWPYRALAAATIAIGLLPWSFGLTVPDPAVLSGTLHGWSVAMFLLAAGGTLLAATTFGPGEPQRPGWLFLSASYLVLVLGRLLTGPGALALGGATSGGRAVASVLASLLTLTGFLLLARTWRQSGLDVGGAGRSVALRLAALVVAAVLAGPDVVEHLPEAARGDLSALGDVLSDLLDGAVFVVAVPVLLATLTLGGGLVVWPWGFLTASLAAWLGYDAVAEYGAAVGLEARSLRLYEELFRTLGSGFAFSAGMAQRWIMGTPPGGGGVRATGPRG
jgi:hypothetical protein